MIKRWPWRVKVWPMESAVPKSCRERSCPITAVLVRLLPVSSLRKVPSFKMRLRIFWRSELVPTTVPELTTFSPWRVCWEVAIGETATTPSMALMVLTSSKVRLLFEYWLEVVSSSMMPSRVSF